MLRAFCSLNLHAPSSDEITCLLHILVVPVFGCALNFIPVDDPGIGPPIILLQELHDISADLVAAQSNAARFQVVPGLCVWLTTPFSWFAE